MSVVNVMVMLHGMTLDAEGRDHADEYRTLRSGLAAREPQLEEVLSRAIEIEWGHKPPNPSGALRPDQQITDAENAINDATSYARVRADPSPYNHLLDVGAELRDVHLTEVVSKWLLRPLVLTPFKEKVMVRGFTDALYYCAPDGEKAVRRAVYVQALERLARYEEEDTVRLHVVAQSLGVTVAFDFLFGLFAPDAHYRGRPPGFIADNAEAAERDERLRRAVDAYARWRERRRQGRLVLGSKASSGGQLGLMMMRKQALVDLLAANRRLDASVIGIEAGAPLKWKVFYDADDALGFPVRRLFEEQAAIQEYEVNTHWRPDLAHSGYWGNEEVQREIARLVVANL